MQISFRITMSPKMLGLIMLGALTITGGLLA